MNMQLTKAERINSKITISNIFSNGEAIFSYPYRMVYTVKPLGDNSIPTEILISVSKKKFKNAVDRNAIKRLIRESYRINKKQLWDYCKENNINLQFAIVYSNSKIEDFEFHNKAMIKLMKKFISKHQNQNPLELTI